MICYENDPHLAHYGILGMKWGVRRYQNADGSLTEAGARRYYKGVVQRERAVARSDSLANSAKKNNLPWVKGTVASSASQQKDAAVRDLSNYKKQGTSLAGISEKEYKEGVRTARIRAGGADIAMGIAGLTLGQIGMAALTSAATLINPMLGVGVGVLTGVQRAASVNQLLSGITDVSRNVRGKTKTTRTVSRVVGDIASSKPVRIGAQIISGWNGINVGSTAWSTTRLLRSGFRTEYNMSAPVQVNNSALVDDVLAENGISVMDSGYQVGDYTIRR